MIGKNTYVQTNKGLFKIKDLFSGDSDICYPNNSISVMDDKGNFQEILLIRKTENADGYKIRFNNGYSIICGKDTIFTSSQSDIKASKLENESFVDTFKLNYTSKYSILNTNKYIYAKAISNFPRKMSNQLAFIIGTMFNSNYKLNYSDSIIEFENEFGKHPNLYFVNCVKGLFGEDKLEFINSSKFKMDKEVYNYLFRITNGYKSVPIQIMSGTEQNQIDFINGLIDNSLWNKLSYVSVIKTKNEELRDQVYGILCSLGFRNMIPHRRMNPGGMYYDVMTSSERDRMLNAGNVIEYGKAENGSLMISSIKNVICDMYDISVTSGYKYCCNQVIVNTI